MRKEEALRGIPQISRIVEKFRGRFSEELVKAVAREVAERFRREIKEGKRETAEGIYEEVERKLLERSRTSLRRVINATGVVINTNLGRAPLSEEVARFILEIATGYSNLEFELSRGERGSRNVHVEGYLKELTGAESALVVNNNAGAVFLVLNTLAKGKEVVVSRGELVEIGGSFRIPDIMRASGANLVEVGTTNRTRISDYEGAVNENTALLMKVHRSNFYMKGFVESVSLEDLVDLGRRKGIPVYYDAGSGLITDLHRIGLKAEEHSFGESIRKGVDLVSGSGDKLLGGPQAGIIIGKKDLIDRMRKNPLMRVLRVDKMTLAGLEMTLRVYLEGRFEDIPVIRMITEREEVLRRKARRLRRRLKGVKGLEVKILREISKPGGGSLPELDLPTYCVSLKHRSMSAEKLATRLREGDPPVIVRISKEAVLLDMRTVGEDEIKPLSQAILKALV
ncbi:MAG: L-seryl-tRNA(Sec) selenium transferase [Aquificota bacterium]|nr:L-seryl-tRNA(Sec) selenium transferase [Aquificota bacterium]